MSRHCAAIIPPSGANMLPPLPQLLHTARGTFGSGYTDLVPLCSGYTDWYGGTLCFGNSDLGASVLATLTELGASLFWLYWLNLATVLAKLIECFFFWLHWFWCLFAGYTYWFNPSLLAILFDFGDSVLAILTKYDVCFSSYTDSYWCLSVLATLTGRGDCPGYTDLI